MTVSSKCIKKLDCHLIAGNAAHETISGPIISRVSMQASESEAKRQLNEGQESRFQSSQIMPEDFLDTQTNALKKCQNVTPPA